MNELRLDNSTHDIVLDGTAISRIGTKSSDTMANRVRQAVLCMLRTEEGEAFADIEEGVPWFGKLLGLPANHLDVATKIINEKIASVEGVKQVKSLTLEVNGRNMTGSFSVISTDGKTTSGEF